MQESGAHTEVEGMNMETKVGNFPSSSTVANMGSEESDAEGRSNPFMGLEKAVER